MGDMHAISLSSIKRAAERIKGDAHETPVLTCKAIDHFASEALGNPVRLFFKCENLQKVGAFKYRGALNAIRKHCEDHPQAEPITFVTHSSGNHAQALALAARDAGHQAIIVMPENSPSVKVAAVAGYGARVVSCAPTVEAREAAAEKERAQANGVFIHPSNDPDVMSGQGTVALELLAQAEKEYGVQLDMIASPVGGGGLLSGIAMAVKSIDPRIRVVGVEPKGAADAHASHSSGKLQGHLTPPHTIADGLRSVLGDNNWPVIRDNVDEIALVSDEEIVSTMRTMWERMKLVVEPSGAVATAALVHGHISLRTSEQSSQALNVGVIITGGNVDLAKLPWTAQL